MVYFMVELPSKSSSSDRGDWWMLYVVGASNPNGSGIGITLEGPGDISLK